MKHNYYAACMALLLLSGFSQRVFAQPNVSVSGIVNSYTSVIGFEFCNNKVIVSNGSSFNVGDKILIIQMKGATTDVTQTSNFGSLVVYNEAGKYEFATVLNVAGNSITLDKKLLNTYDYANSVQIIRVPHYQNLTVADTLKAKPWDGSSGGVIVIDVDDTLYMNAPITASGRGFLGAQTSVGGDLCGEKGISGPDFNPEGARKGEGIAEYNSNHSTCMGAWANAGGGGNDHNAGGGGGANATAGGKGGNEATPRCGIQAINGGWGGYPLQYSNTLNRIFMGGGGGAGHVNDGGLGYGSNGGGIIIIRAGAIISNGFPILADGAYRTDSSQIDGAGGGGAGGTILLDVANYVDNLTVKADGGKGQNTFGGIYCHGNGGGGSGGVIWYSGSHTTPGNGKINFSLKGGKAGVCLPASSGATNGATDGQDGITLNGLTFNQSTRPFIAYKGSLRMDTTVCVGDSLSLGCSAPGIKYTWTPTLGLSSSTDPNVKAAPISTTTYILKIEDIGCVQFDTFIVNIKPYPTVITNNDETVCSGLPKVLTASGASSYLWSTGDTTSSITVTPSITETYWVKGRNNDCFSLPDSVTLTVINAIQIDVSPNDSVCVDEMVTLTAKTNLPVIWSTGATTSSIQLKATILQQIKVRLDVTSSPGLCALEDSVSIVPFALPTYTIDKKNIACLNDSFLLNANSSGFEYLWSNGQTTSEIYVKEGGKYWLRINNGGCIVTDTIEVIDANKSLKDFVIPNVFTPNYDGVNDQFETQIPESSTFYEFKVFNRWGLMVFWSLDRKTWWDGMDNEGVEMMEGTYYWTMTLRNQCGGSQVSRGDVTLVR